MKLPINRYQIKRALPTITTIGACVGVVATGVWSAKAMYDYMQGVDTSLEAKLKAAVGPTLCGLVTMGLMAFTRTMDAKAIAGLAAAEAVAAKQVSDLQCAIKEVVDEETLNKVNDKVAEYHEKDYGHRFVAIVGENAVGAEIYYDPNIDLYFRATNEIVRSAFERLNRNYQLRGGLASCYEWLRFLGITKAQIDEFGLDWTEWVGWHRKFMDENGFSWIDDVQTREDQCIVIDWMFPFMPITSDPPKYIHDKCHTDEADTEDLDTNDILDMIKVEIHDNDVD